MRRAWLERRIENGEDMEAVNIDHSIVENKEMGKGAMAICSMSLFSIHHCFGAALASPLVSLECWHWATLTSDTLWASVTASVSPSLLHTGVSVVYFLAPGWHSTSWLYQSQAPVRAETYWLAFVSFTNEIHFKRSFKMFVFWGKQFLSLVGFIRNPESFSYGCINLKFLKKRKHAYIGNDLGLDHLTCLSR